MNQTWAKRAGAAGLLIAAVAIYLLTDSSSASIPSLVMAVGRNDVPTLRSIIERDPSAVRQVDLSGNTPLHIAAMGGFEETVDLLIQAHADVNAPNKAGYPPLAAALMSESKQGAIVKKLIAAGASPDIKLPDGRRLSAVATQLRASDPQAFALLASNTGAGKFK